MRSIWPYRLLLRAHSYFLFIFDLLFYRCWFVLRSLAVIGMAAGHFCRRRRWRFIAADETLVENWVFCWDSSRCRENPIHWLWFLRILWIFDHFENVQIEHHLECDNLNSSLGWHAVQPLGHCFVPRFLGGSLRYCWRDFLALLCYVTCCSGHRFFGSILFTFLYEFSYNLTPGFDIIFIIKKFNALNFKIQIYGSRSHLKLMYIRFKS